MWRNSGYFWWMLPALAATAAFFWLGRRRRRRLGSLLGAPESLARLIPPERAKRRAIRIALQSAALILIFIALAGPQWGVELVESHAKTRQILIAVDTSLSMNAQDVAPSRFGDAEKEIQVLLQELKGNRVGIMAFSGQASLICPLTTDDQAVGEAANALSVGMLPTAGTGIGTAVRQAARILSGYPGEKALVLLTDGEDHHTDALAAAQAAARQDVRLYAIGIGTPAGAPIPIRDSSGHLTGYLQYKGRTVVSRLGEKLLAQMAQAGGGAYFRAGPDQNEAVTIARQITKTTQAQAGVSTVSRYKNHFRLPLAAALLLLAAEFLVPETGALAASSGGKIALMAGLLILASAARSRAATAEGDLREGNKLYHQEKYLPALEKYSAAAAKEPEDVRPAFNAGDALFRLEQMDESAQSFKALGRSKAPAPLRSAAYYNLGDIHYAQGDYKKAVEAFRRAVILNPSDPDARYNLAVALRAMKHPPPRSQRRRNSRQPPKPKNQGGKKSGSKGGPKKLPAPQKNQGQMSQEDANRIRQAVAQREKAMAIKRRQSNPGKAPSGEDW